MQHQETRMSAWRVSPPPPTLVPGAGAPATPPSSQPSLSLGEQAFAPCQPDPRIAVSHKLRSSLSPPPSALMATFLHDWCVPPHTHTHRCSPSKEDAGRASGALGRLPQFFVLQLCSPFLVSCVTPGLCLKVMHATPLRDHQPEVPLLPPRHLFPLPRDTSMLLSAFFGAHSNSTDMLSIIIIIMRAAAAAAACTSPGPYSEVLGTLQGQLS